MKEEIIKVNIGNKMVCNKKITLPEDLSTKREEFSFEYTNQEYYYMVETIVSVFKLEKP